MCVCIFEFIWKAITSLNSVLKQETSREREVWLDSVFCARILGGIKELKKFFKSQQHSWDIDIEYQETKETSCLTAVVTLSCITVQQPKSKRYAKFTKDSSDAFFPPVHVERHQEKEGGYKCKNICSLNPFEKYFCKNKCESSIVYSRWKCNMFNLRGGKDAIEEPESMEIK